MRVSWIVTGYLTLAAIIGIRPVRAQNLSSSLSEYLVQQGNAVVYLAATKRLPNHLVAPFRGTGFVISPDGHVITAAHVVDGISRPTLGVSHESEKNQDAIFQYEGRLGSANAEPHRLTLEKLDDLRDLAILKFDEKRDYPYFRLASGDGLHLTDQVLALGFPLNTTAIIPAFGRITDVNHGEGRWLIDAAVNPGHSGGPVIRRDGAVVGIVHAGIQGVSLMNLFLPFALGDLILDGSDVHQLRTPWPPVDVSGGSPSNVPMIGDGGPCADGLSTSFTDPSQSLYWACAARDVPAGVKPNIEKSRTIRVEVPSSAAIVKVWYFNRTRKGDPVDNAEWVANPPETPLPWMMIEKAEVFETGQMKVVQTECRNESHNLPMNCALGVQYRARAWLW